MFLISTDAPKNMNCLVARIFLEIFRDIISYLYKLTGQGSTYKTTYVLYIERTYSRRKKNMTSIAVHPHPYPVDVDKTRGNRKFNICISLSHVGT